MHVQEGLYVHETGSEHSTCVLWLHGALVAGWMWEAQIAALPGFHHLVPDLPGVGRSAATGPRSIAEAAAAMLDLVGERAANKPVHLVGLSLGAVVGLHMMAQRPQGFASVLLSGPLARPVTGPMVMLQRVLIALYGSATGARLVARALRLPDDVRPAFCATAAATPPGTYRRLLPELYARPLPDAPLNTVDVPVLLVTGSRDTAITRNSIRDLLQILPNARGLWADGLGHQWNAEDGERFSQMVAAWLTGTTMPEGLSEIPDDSTSA